MKYYKGYPIVIGKPSSNTSIEIRCPYCGRLEHYYWNESRKNPTKRKSHCFDRSVDYIYIYVKGGERDGRKSDV